MSRSWYKSAKLESNLLRTSFPCNDLEAVYIVSSAIVFGTFTVPLEPLKAGERPMNS